MEKSTQTSGYTLLFAVLTATLVLGVAVFILSVSSKQFALSVAARDSMYSLYAADSGIECAAASISGISTSTTPGGSGATITIACNGNTSSPATFTKMQGLNSPDPKIWPLNGADRDDFPIYAAERMVIDLDIQNKTCALVTIADGYYVDDNGVVRHKTTIESRGYNYCDAGAGPHASSRTVERALRLTYRSI